MTSQAELSQRHRYLLALGELWDRTIDALLKNEERYDALGVNRDAADVRAAASASISLITTAVRDNLRMRGRFLGDKDILNDLALKPVPTPLTVLLLEMTEIANGRPSGLLTHDGRETGDGPYNFIRRQTKAFAAAAVEVLMETGVTEKVAAKAVAKVLNELGFTNPKSQKSYSPATIMDWRKRSKEKKLEFDADFKRNCLMLRGTVGRVEMFGGSLEEAEALILKRFRHFVLAFTYR